MRRRDFVQRTMIAGAGLAIPPQMRFTKQSPHIGVQLYSVRDDIKTNTITTLKAIRVMGYREVEGFGYRDGKFFDMTPADYKSILMDNGLSMPTAHCDINLHSWKKRKGLTDHTKKAVEDAAFIGQKVFICPSINKSERDAESVRKLCDVFHHVAEYCGQYKMLFGYHNHAFEFQHAGDLPIYDHILSRSDASLVRLQLDIYWAIRAGIDPIALIHENPGRFISFHVKDMADTPERQTIEVGEGIIDFKGIFAFSALAGVKYYVVELEDYRRPPLEGIEVCLHNLQKLLA